MESLRNGEHNTPGYNFYSATFEITETFTNIVRDGRRNTKITVQYNITSLLPLVKFLHESISLDKTHLWKGGTLF